MQEAIFLVEYSNIPYGIAALDRLVKRSAVSVLYANPVCIGRYLIVVGGSVEDVGESQAEVEAIGTTRRISQYLLTNAHRDISAYFKRFPKNEKSISGAQAAGIFETRDTASGFRSLDCALKNGSVEIGKIWMGHYLGGKFCYVLTGQVGDVETAVNAARHSIIDRQYADSCVIPSPDTETLRLIVEHYN